MENMELRNDQEVKQMSFLQRVIGVIVSPKKAMEAIVQKSDILYPILAMLLTTPIFYLIRYPLFEQMVKTKLENTPQAAQMTPSMISFSTKIGLITAPIGVIIMWIVITFIFWGILRIFKGEGKFKQYLSVTGYAYTIVIISMIVTLIASYFTGSLILDTSLASITNLFAPDLKGSFLYGIIRGINLFGIWQFIVYAIGLKVVSKLSSAKVYSVVSVVYIVMILLSANSLKLS
ncbi:MAG: Yip1 family protein [Thermoanaerobacteraceae bacterium]|nr:Yip1 family protein [Thermoanaerobacteraceae bacterium]